MTDLSPLWSFTWSALPPTPKWSEETVLCRHDNSTGFRISSGWVHILPLPTSQACDVGHVTHHSESWLSAKWGWQSLLHRKALKVVSPLCSPLIVVYNLLFVPLFDYWLLLVECLHPATRRLTLENRICVSHLHIPRSQSNTLQIFDRKQMSGAIKWITLHLSWACSSESALLMFNKYCWLTDWAI